jgi:hypothetical protein
MVGERPAHQPQQSVLKPHDEQRHTACIRYISALQRSQSILSSPEDVAGEPGPDGIFNGVMGRGG